MNKKSESEPQNQESSEEKNKLTLQQELKKYYSKFKNKLKLMSKSDIISLIWEQGIEYRKLQDVTQELYEQNKLLKAFNESKGIKNEEIEKFIEESSKSNDENIENSNNSIPTSTI